MPRTAKTTIRAAKSARRSTKANKTVRHGKRRAASTPATIGTLCTCGCGQPVGNPKRLWLPGHDQRMKGILIRIHLKKADIKELSPLVIERYSRIPFMQADSRYRAVIEAARKAGK